MTPVELDIQVSAINANSPHLETVIALGYANAKTLGFMPRGGFQDYARKQHILVALTAEEQCVGYLMYRSSNQAAYIVHLCVDKQWRGQHIASKLIEYLIQTTERLYSVRLACRRDYKVDKMWTAFGFTPRYDKIGRSKDSKLLTVWILEHEHPNLLTMLTQKIIDSKLCAVLDANVFYDLNKDSINRQTEDSKALLADWFQSEVELCITDEIAIEINRNKNSIDREKQRAFASFFTQLTCSREKLQKASEALKKHFPERITENDDSDLRHVARAIAANAQFFITRDDGVLSKEEAIYIEFNLSILRPSDLIIRLDELRREVAYQPVRVGGTTLERRLVQANQQTTLAEAFIGNKSGETRVEFQRYLRKAMVEPNRFECCVVWDEQQDPLALLIYDRQESHELKISMLRLRRSYAFSATVLRHLVLLSIKTAAQENRSFTRVVDEHLEDFVILALQQDNFVQTQKGWLRANIATAQTANSLSDCLRHLTKNLSDDYQFCLQFATALEAMDAVEDVTLMSELERNLYPVKITDAQIPSFIVSIQPQWAENLFDEDLAKQDLFGADKNLALRREVVYYRSIRNSGRLEAPGRILWYVSQGKSSKNYYQAKAIRACSRLDEIIVDTPKNLFRQFRRLGVYKFENVLERANGKLDNEVMAIRFSDTELFSKPIPYGDVQKILEKPNPLLSPCKISAEVFNKLYTRGI